MKTGIVEALHSRMSGNDYLEAFAQQVDSAELDQKVPAFWLKGNDAETYAANPMQQASMVALYRNGMLSCTGKPGSMSFYLCNSASVMKWIFRVGSMKSAMLFNFFITLFVFLPLARMNSFTADVALLVFGVVVGMTHFIRANLYTTFFPIVAFVPGNMTGLALNGKIGFYWLTFASAAAAVYVSVMRLTSGYEDVAQTEITGLIEGLGNGYALHIEMISAVWGEVQYGGEFFWLCLAVGIGFTQYMVVAVILGLLARQGGEGGAFKKLQNAGVLKKAEQSQAYALLGFRSTALGAALIMNIIAAIHAVALYDIKFLFIDWM